MDMIWSTTHYLTADRQKQTQDLGDFLSFVCCRSPLTSTTWLNEGLGDSTNMAPFNILY